MKEIEEKSKDEIWEQIRHYIGYKGPDFIFSTSVIRNKLNMPQPQVKKILQEYCEQGLLVQVSGNKWRMSR